MLVPNLAWKEYDVRGELSRKLGLQVELENDTNACLSIGDGEWALLRGAAAVVLQRHSGYSRSAHGKQPKPAAA